LKDINVYKNPVEINASSFNVLMAEVLSKNTKLARFSRVKVEDCHKLEAYFLGKYKWEKEEAEKKARAAKEAADAEKENE
jgi:hypothetical protein